MFYSLSLGRNPRQPEQSVNMSSSNQMSTNDVSNLLASLSLVPPLQASIHRGEPLQPPTLAQHRRQEQGNPCACKECLVSIPDIFHLV